MPHITRQLSQSRILKRPRSLVATVALVVGIAAVPTVALAVTTDALPGDPLKLGQENKIANATTTLTGTESADQNASTLKGVLAVRRESGVGPVLKVENTTNTTIGGQGLDIRVAPGKRPINVNNDAGKSNLNVDKLDGRDEEDFLTSRRIYRRGMSVQGQTGNGGSVLLAGPDMGCDDGDIAIGGGGNAIGIEDDLNAVIPASSSSYQVEFQDNEPRGGKFDGFVLCSDSARPFIP
jgi:hypothetical protein